MHNRIEKQKTTESRAVANSTVQKKENQGLKIVDNRPKSVSQRVLDDSISNLKLEYLITTIRKNLGVKASWSDVRDLILIAKEKENKRYNMNELQAFVREGLKQVVEADKSEEVPNKKKKKKKSFKKAPKKNVVENEVELEVEHKQKKKKKDKKPVQNLELFENQGLNIPKQPVENKKKEEEIQVEQNQEIGDHTPGPHNIEMSKEYFNNPNRKVHIPATITIKDMFRGDSRKKGDLANDGFKHGKRAKGYLKNLKRYLNDQKKKGSEVDSRTMISRDPGRDISEKGDKPKPPIDLVYSTETLIIKGKTIKLLNYVCTGPDVGAGATNYLIKINEVFHCVAASPTIGLYQSASGIKILAVAQGAAKKGTAPKFTEYDFLTNIPPNLIYYASNDNGNTQADKGNSWFSIVDNSPC